jgi:hypothetical protein
VLEIEDRVQGVAERPGRLVHHRRILVLDPAAHRGVDEGDALGDDPADPSLARRGEQVARALGANPIGGCVELGILEVEDVGERGQLVHDDLRAGLGHREGERVPVVDVADDTARAVRLDLNRGRRPSCHPGRVVAGLDQASHQRSSDRSRGPGDEDARAHQRE